MSLWPSVPVSDMVLSSNVTDPNIIPDDPGVALYFKWDNRQFAIAADLYELPESNLITIYYIVAARQAELALGSLSLVRASMAGFTALPPPMEHWHWSDVLGVSRSSSVDEIEAAWRSKAKQSHPDAGGSLREMQALNRARDAALKERS